MSKLVSESHKELSSAHQKHQAALLYDTIHSLPPTSFNKQGKINFKDLWNRLQVRNYYAHDSIAELKDFLIDNADDFDVEGMITIPKEKRKRRKEAWARDVIDQFSDAEVDFENADPEDYVFRSYMGTGDVKIYKDDVLSKEDYNQLKKAYSILTDINYFDVRPIQYKNWIKLPDHLKHQTYEKDPKMDY